MLKKDIISYSVVLIPLLKPYLLFGINADLLGFVFIAIYAFLFCRYNLKSHKELRYYAILAIYSIIIPPLISVLTINDGYSISLLPILLLLYLEVVLDNAEFPKIFKIYKFVSLACCLFFFFQEIYFYLSSSRISGLLPFLDNVYSKSWGVTSKDFILSQLGKDRSASIFLEPAHFVQYIAPCLGILLFNKRYFSIFPIICITSAMVLSRSGNGLLLLAVIYGMFVLKSDIKKLWKFSLVSVITVSMILFLGTEEGFALMSRSNEMSLTNMERHSGFIRAYRGYFLWTDLDPIQQFFGIGGNINFIFDNPKFGWMFATESDRFLNGVQSILFFSGVLGLVFFACFIHTLYKKSTMDNTGKVILFAIVTLMFIESIYNTSYMVLYIVLVLQYYRSNIKKQVIKVR